MKKFILLLLSLQCILYHVSLAQNPGDLDNSFGSGGIVSIPTALYPDWVDIAIQPDGKIVSGGNTIVRLDVNGSLDPTFSFDGIDTLKVNDTIYNCRAISIQPDGKILAVGGPIDGNIGLGDFLLVRYKTDGGLDSTFDGDGVVRTSFDMATEDFGNEVAIQPDGKIIVAGGSGGYLAICRYNSDGSLDNAFDNDGKFVSNTVWSAAYLKLQTDGKILVGNGYDVVRLNSDGSMDNSFGNNGVVALAYGMSDLVVQPDGKIALAGSGFSVIRFNANGSLDNNFGNGGVAVRHWPYPVCGNTGYNATSIALQPDGRILAGGYYWCGWLSPYREFILTRYNPDGAIDSSFGSDGLVRTYILQTSAVSSASVITSDMKIVLSGISYTDLGDPGPAVVARYSLGWSLDVNTVPTNNENFVIAPNPTFDEINIEASKIENGPWHLEMRDITGRSILQEDIVAKDGSIQKKISLNDLPAGLYFVQLDNGKNKMVSKVAKYR